MVHAGTMDPPKQVRKHTRQAPYVVNNMYAGCSPGPIAQPRQDLAIASSACRETRHRPLWKHVIAR
jgi:hypothetical protein